MGISCPQLSIFMYTAQKNDLEAQLSHITEEKSMLSYYMNNLMQNEDWYKDPQVKLVQIQDNQLDMEKLKIETNIKAVNSNLESQQKLIDNNIKNEFGYSLSL